MELFAVYLGLASLGTLFWLLERRRHPSRVAPSQRRARVAYWLLTPLVTGTLSRLVLLGALGLIALALHFPDGWIFLDRIVATSPFGRLPTLATIPCTLLMADFFGYWSHRARHSAALWAIHAVHHAPEDMRALDAAQLHPLDEVFDTLVIGVPVLLAGSPFAVYAALGPFFILHTLMLHADLPWTFGPLRRVLASPAFHRRHHARDLPAANFGGVFAFWDVCFGTYAAPPTQAAACGVAARDVPRSVAGQLAFPLSKVATSLAARLGRAG